MNLALWIIIDIMSLGGANAPVTDFETPITQPTVEIVETVDPRSGETVELQVPGVTIQPIPTSRVLEGDTFAVVRCIVHDEEGNPGSMVAGHVNITTGVWADSLADGRCVLELDVADALGDD
jgi:hypothetical protein